MDSQTLLFPDSSKSSTVGRVFGIITVMLGGTAVGLVALYHVRQPNESLAGVVLSGLVIFATTLPTYGIGWWLYRSSYDDSDIARVLGWSFLGGIPLAALMVIVARYQQSHGVIIHDLLFVVATVAGIGFVGGSLTGIYDVERAQRETDYRCVDRQFTTVIEAAPVAVIALDDSNRIQLWNDAATDLFGYERDDIIGEHCPVSAKGSDDCCCFRATGSPHEFECERKDGSRIAVECRTARIPETHPSDCRRIAILSDVTTQNRRQQRLAVLHRVLRHNLRTGVNVAQGHAHLLADAADTAQAERSADAIMEVADDLYALSEKAGQVDRTLRRSSERTESRDLIELVTQHIDAMVARYPHAEFELNAPDRAFVQADEGLGTAIEEALENAVIHNDTDTPHVEVTISRAHGEQLTVTVADNGPGIPPSQRKPVQDGYETQIRHVTGLGLWLLTWIVNSNGGTLEFGTNDPRGTTVTMSLPAAPVREPSSQTPVSSGSDTVVGAEQGPSSSPPNVTPPS